MCFFYLSDFLKIWLTKLLNWKIKRIQFQYSQTDKFNLIFIYNFDPSNFQLTKISIQFNLTECAALDQHLIAGYE